MVTSPKRVRAAWTRAYRRRIKREALDHYGRACRRCGNDDVRVLSLDHMNGGGEKDRAGAHHRTGGWFTYQRLKKRGWPADIQVLCLNCHAIVEDERRAANLAA